MVSGAKAIRTTGLPPLPHVEIVGFKHFQMANCRTAWPLIFIVHTRPHPRAPIQVAQPLHMVADFQWPA